VEVAGAQSKLRADLETLTSFSQKEFYKPVR
jgi:hypothetical protein